MAWPRKKQDPLSDRARTLNDEIGRLEAEIKRLDAQLQRDKDKAQPKLRSTTTGRGETVSQLPAPPVPPEPPVAAPTPSAEPIFEEMDKARLHPRDDASRETEIYNELGVRKYDLQALWQRLSNHFRGPSTSNPKLVSYLAAGGIQGLRPLRYEKRVARNRFIALVAAIFLTLLGIIYEFAAHNR